MVRRETLRKNFAFLEDRVLGILLYGSRVHESITSRSDNDICIVIGRRDPSLMQEIYEAVWRTIDVRGLNLDVKVFEELPLHIQVSIIHHHELLLSKNTSDLYEYFYMYRKRWKDQKHRQKLSKEEKQRLLRK